MGIQASNSVTSRCFESPATFRNRWPRGLSGYVEWVVGRRFRDHQIAIPNVILIMFWEPDLGSWQRSQVSVFGSQIVILEMP
jgi:hypothetical protein